MTIENVKLHFTKNRFFYFGLIFIVLYFSPYWLNGEDAVFPIHDFLEIGIPNLYLNAKYLFQPLVTEIPDILGGTFRGSIQASSIFDVLLYWLIGDIAYLNVFILIAAILPYTGLFIFLHLIVSEKNVSSEYIITICSVLYGLLYNWEYGFTGVAFPLFLSGVIVFIQQQVNCKSILVFLLMTVFIGAMTMAPFSLGVYQATLLLGGIYCFYKCRKNHAWILLLGVLFFTIMQLASIPYSLISLHEVSHRISWQTKSSPFIKSLYYLLFDGDSIHHAPGLFLFTVSFFALLWTFVYKRKCYCCKNIVFVFTLMLLIGIVSAFGTTEFYYSILASHIGVFKSLQLSRFTLLLPFLWYCGLAFVFLQINNVIATSKKVWCFIAVTTSILLIFSVNKSYIWNCITVAEKIHFPVPAFVYSLDQYRDNSYKNFFEFEAFDNIRKELGSDLDSVYVASLGIDPGVIIRNGFKTLDAYSVNYRLSYKNKFRTIIEHELALSSEFAHYYDSWGSRVNLVSHELPFFIPQGTILENVEINDLRLNFDVLKELNCKFIFSAYVINNAEENLNLRHKVLRDDQKHYLYVYEIL